MRTTVTKNVILFILFTLITFIFSCSPELHEYPQSNIETQNEIAAQLLSLMHEQKGSYTRFEKKLGSHKALYDYVQTGNSTDFGLYYAIPYLDEKDSLSGCIVYPIDENCDEEVRSYKGTLGHPIDLNQDYLENKVPITRRFLYSARFLQWKDRYSQNPLKALYSFAEKLKEKEIVIQSKTPTSIRLRSNTRNISAATINFHFDYMEYLGPIDGAAHALSPGSINSLIYQGCRYYLPVGAITIKPLHNGAVRVDITFREKISSIDSRLYQVAHEITYRALCSQFNIFLQFDYTIVTTSEAGSESSHGGSGGAYNPPSSGSNPPPPSPKKPVEDCSQSRDHAIAMTFKKVTKNILNQINKVQKDPVYKKYSDFQTFLNKVHSDSVEYSISFEQYPNPDGQSMENRITNPVRGEKYSVTSTVGSYTTATIHNHINPSPPSIRDLFFTANLANTATNKCRTTYIYNQVDSTFYALQIVDPSKARGFYHKFHEGELDKKTNGYKAKGAFDRFIKAKQFNCTASEYPFYRLVSILDKFNTGIILIKIDKHNNAISYKATTQQNKKGKEVKALKLTYCEDQ